MKMTMTPTASKLALVFALTASIFTQTSCDMNAKASAAGSLSTLPAETKTASAPAPVSNTPVETKPAAIADAATIIAREEVPILCYHQIRDWKPTDSKTAKDYIVPVDNFRQQMKSLADSGYHTILPDQLYAYLTAGAALPTKPIMLTFDDTDLDQYTVALPEMEKYGFKGVYFIMTVSLGRPRYMTKEQVKDLSGKGHEIGSHTWNHSNVKKYAGDDWKTQIEKPSAVLESITGKKVKYFAYPFGLWNKEAIPELKKRGFDAVFQLTDKRDPQDPLYTIRRMIVPGSWSTNTMHAWMRRNF